MKTIKLTDNDLYIKTEKATIILKNENNKNGKDLVIDAIISLIERIDDLMYNKPYIDPGEYEKDIKRIRRAISINKKYVGPGIF